MCREKNSFTLFNEVAISKKLSSKLTLSYHRNIVVYNHFVKVYLGGGRKHFLSTAKKNSVQAGFRNDGRNLIDEWVSDKRDKGTAIYVDNKVGFCA